MAIFVSFQNDLNFPYSVERVDEETMTGNVWVWITDNADVEKLKSHSGFIGSRLLKDNRG